MRSSPAGAALNLARLVLLLVHVHLLRGIILAREHERRTTKKCRPLRQEILSGLGTGGVQEIEILEAKKEEVLCDSLDVLLVGSNSVVRQGASNRLRLHARTLARPRSYTCSCRSAQPRFLESAPYNFRTNTTSGKALLCIRVEKEKH